MMRIAIAGGSGLGYLLATELSQAENAYNVVVLSRTPRPEFNYFDIQVHVVDYDDHASLAFALRGIELVICTVAGPEQLNLINAAGSGRVRYFVPAEFEGSLSHRPSLSSSSSSSAASSGDPATIAAITTADALDRGSAQALQLLKHWSQASRMQYTVFSCGVFMERFQPYGLGSLGIGFGSAVAGVGDYLLDVNGATAEYVERDAKGHQIRVCLTSVYDVVRLVVAAVDLGPSHWPREYTMRGDRMSIRDIIGKCSQARNAAFEHQQRQYAELATYLNYYMQTGEYDRAAYYQRLIATANGRYDFSHATLNEAMRKNGLDVRLLTFSEWLVSVWQPPV